MKINVILIFVIKDCFAIMVQCPKFLDQRTIIHMKYLKKHVCIQSYRHKSCTVFYRFYIAEIIAKLLQYLAVKSCAKIKLQNEVLSHSNLSCSNGKSQIS